MSSYSFKLPDLGEGIVESEVAKWYINIGDHVKEDQHIADVITDKAVVEITSPVNGTITAMACKAGDVLAVGSELICFNIDDNDVSKEVPENKTEVKPQHVATTVDKPTSVPRINIAEPTHHNCDQKSPTSSIKSAPILTSPSVRQRARDEQVDLSLVSGSGPAGRISHQDLDSFITSKTTSGFVHTAKLGRNEIKIKGVRRAIAKKMVRTTQDIPHYSYIEEIDMTNLEELRLHMNTHRYDQQPKLTLLPFIVQALVKILPSFPHCNANFEGETDTLIQYDAVHMGIATMTDEGLMVPVIHHCESLDIWQTANKLAQVSQAARSNKAIHTATNNSTITITSLGSLGGIATTPIINAPETAIIGINKLEYRPVVKNNAIKIRQMMNISSSFDHRIVDGYDGAKLIQTLKSLLENPATIFV